MHWVRKKRIFKYDALRQENQVLKNKQKRKNKKKTEKNPFYF